MTWDLLVIGGGPGGYTAAIRAAQLGATVTLIEEEGVGGTCLNRGCIPTKALYKNAQVILLMEKAAEFGIEVSEFSSNVLKMHEQKQKIINQLQEGITRLLKAYNVTLIKGKASFVDAKTVVVKSDNGKRNFTAEKILIATGSLPASLAIPGSDLPGVVTSTEILELNKIPKSMAVIGGGVIGIEIAGIFNALGTSVTVMELLPTILPTFDAELVKRLTMGLKRGGIKVETGIAVQEIKQSCTGLEVMAQRLKDKIVLDVETVLISTGRTLNVSGLNLDSLGVLYDRSGIKVDDNFQTSIPGIHAVGDVIGGQMLAHLAAEEGKAAVERMRGLPGHVNYNVVPACVFTFPETAGVGMTEEQARNQGILYQTSKFLFGANGKALTMREGEGLVKVIARKDNGELLGVHIMGPHASDLIHEGALALEHRLTATDVVRTMHAHPTLSESLAEAMLGLDNRAIHLLPKRP